MKCAARCGAAVRWLAPRLGLAIASALLLFGLAEAFIRLTIPRPAPVHLRDGIFVSQLPLVSGRDTVDRQSGSPLPITKRPGERRVFVFGESSVQGSPWGYHGSPVTMLYDQLHASAPTLDLTVVNMGRGAAFTRDAYYFLDSVEVFRPDVIVFYMGNNDLYRGDGELCLPATHPRLHATWRWVVERSRLLWTLRALGPYEYSRRRGSSNVPSGFMQPDDCDPELAFTAWTEVLVRRARAMGAAVVVATPIQNALMPIEGRVDWNAHAQHQRSESYDRLLRCQLTPGCDLAPVLVRENFPPPWDNHGRGRPLASRERAWRYTAAQHGAALVDFAEDVARLTNGMPLPPLLVDEVHLDLDGYWRLAWRLASAVRPLLDGGPAPRDLQPGEPPPFDRERYLRSSGGTQGIACKLLRHALPYERAGRILTLAAILRLASNLDRTAPDRPATTPAGRVSQLLLGKLRQEVGLSPDLPAPLAERLGLADFEHVRHDIAHSPDCAALRWID